jgi:twin BRCT domain
LDIQIKDHGGDVIIHQDPAPFPAIEQFTHIISSTADFPAYQSACDTLIPVVKPQWLQVSIAKMKLANPRQFSPDPKMFFSDVVVTCGDIPEGDKDAIVGGVMAMGGLYSSRVTSQVTHLVDLSVDSDKAKVVTSKGLGVKIVLPHWCVLLNVGYCLSS